MNSFNIFSQLKYVPVLIITLLFTTGCQLVYKQDIPQGNIIAEENLAKLKVGLTEEQVHYLFGTPMLNDAFHATRWDYLYYFKPGYGKTEGKHLVILFEEGKVVSYHFEPLVRR